MIKLELTEQMLGIISRALGTQPFDVVVATVMEIQRQVNAQRGISTKVTNGGLAAHTPKPTEEKDNARARRAG